MASAAGQRYEVLDRLAAGGMAEILAARVREGPLKGRILVLKRMLPHLARDTSYLQMFQDEARILSMLDHPNVVRMYESGNLDGLPYIAMEYIEGHDIRAAIVAEHHRGRRIPLGHVLAIVAGAAAGLDYSHERKDPGGRPLDIIHRDISPHNLLVTYDGLVKVVDFGIAKAQGRLNETRQSTLKGKLPYMAPEQAGGGAIDRRADVYSLGAVLYELTTGKRPYRGKNDLQLLNAILYTPIPRPSSLVAEYPAELERIVMKALSREAAGRYARAEEMRAELLAFARSARLDASPPALGRYMQELFSVQLAELRKAREEGVDLPTVLVGWARDAEGGEDEEEVEKSGGNREAGQPWWVEERKVGGVKVVSLGGRLTELFRGAEVALRLEGKVVLDLGEVERITSFGVREWLRMIDDSAGRLSELYLSRCTEAVVNQLRMIRRLSGKGQVVSFYAPYKCPKCGSQFEALLEGGRHGEQVKKGVAPVESCPRCASDAALDDDPRAYFSFATGMVTSAPPDVRAALETLQPPPAAVDKAVHGGITRYRLRAALDEALRWGRILEGAEGGIEVDLARATRVTAPGALGLARALKALGPEVKAVSVVAAPAALLDELARSADPRVKLHSGKVPTTCAKCGASKELELEVGAKLPRCPACGGALELKLSAAAQQLLARPEAPGGAARRKRAPAVAVAATLLLAASAVGAAVLLPRAGGKVRAVEETVPAWASAGVVSGALVYAPGTGRGPSREAALEAARAEAVAALGPWLAQGTPAGGGQEATCKLARRPLPDAAAIARILGGAAAGSLAVAEVVVVGGTTYVKFGLTRTAATEAQAALGARVTALGMTVSRCGEALVVTEATPGGAAHRAGVRAGDVLMAVDGAPPGSLEAVVEAARAAGPAKELRLTVEVGGSTRTVRLKGE